MCVAKNERLSCEICEINNERDFLIVIDCVLNHQKMTKDNHCTAQSG